MKHREVPWVSPQKKKKKNLEGNIPDQWRNIFKRHTPWFSRFPQSSLPSSSFFTDTTVSAKLRHWLRGQAQRSYWHAITLGSTLSSATSGDRTSNLKVLIKFLTRSSSPEAQTHPIPEGLSLDPWCQSWSGDSLPASAGFPPYSEAAGPVASGAKVEPCPAAQQPASFLRFWVLGLLKSCVCSQHSAACPSQP